MIRIGWFSPISTQTGIAQYSRNVLEELRRLVPQDEVQVIVFHPVTSDTVVKMPYPTIEMSESLITSDFAALFDVAIYHLGNNDKNHGPIYAAARRHPGIVVLHDYVYQHYLAGISIHAGYLGPSFGGLIHSVGGQRAFDFLADSGVLKSDEGNVLFVPWDGQWGTQFPLGDRLARLGSAAIVHSDYGRRGLGADFAGPTLQLFMPRPAEPEAVPAIATEGSRIHIVCGGHIGSTKGLRLLTAAFAENPALKAQFRVTVAGFGSDKDFLALLESDIRNIGLAAVFDLCVDPSDDDFAPVMATADVFYNLRYPNTEGASLSLVEQMAHHRAVIAYRTGCFAELPEDACFFLEKIGDAAELADLLGQIAGNRGELRIRGEKAWAAVCEKTAARYAETLLHFIEVNMERLKARAALVQSRAQLELPQAAPQDEAWLRDYVTNKILLDEFYEHHLYLSDGFLDSTAEEKCRFLMLNLLHTRSSAEDAQAIAAILDKKSPLALFELVGRLLRFSEQIVFNRSLLSPSLEDIALQGYDLDFWRIVLRLPAKMGVPMARAALAIPYEMVGELMLNAERDGLGPALSNYLQLRGDTLVTRATLTPLLALLHKITARPLLPVERNTDLVDLLRKKQRNPSLRTLGFHPVEPIGIWTATTEAALHLQIDPENPANELSLRATSLVAGQTVDICVLEQDSDRSETMSVVFGADSAAPADQAQLALPAFAGPLSITISVGNVQSPQSLDLSADPRNLGVLLYSLKLL